MAVSFKVPSSPPKSIFTIDEFLGVDLTNSPANIQDNRSPNAPNMTRLVPGKVRKRMGYEKEVLFGTKTNVNWALGTSCEEQIFTVSEDEINTWKPIYEYVKRLDSPDGNRFDLYVEFDYKAEKEFTVFADWFPQPTEFTGEWVHYSGSYNFGAAGYTNRFSIYSEYEQDISFKNFSIMYDKNSSYEWSPAPKHFVETTSNSEVFGFHKFIASGSDANVMLDINRALETATAKTIVHLTADYTDSIIYYLAEDIIDGRNVIVKFDYEFTGNVTGVLPNIHLGNSSVVNFREIVEVPVAGQTYTGTYIGETKIETQQGYDYQWIGCLTVGGGITLKVSNFSLLYAKSDSYTWKAAPEDSSVYGRNMPLQLYDQGDTNYSDFEYYTHSETGSQAGMIPFTITLQSTANLKGYSYLTGKLKIATESQHISDKNIKVVYSDGINEYYMRHTYGSTAPTDGTWDLNSVFCPVTAQPISPAGSGWSNDYYIKGFYIEVTTTDAETVTVTLSDIKLVSLTQREDLYESSYVNLYHVGDKVFSYKTSGDFAITAQDVNLNRSMSWQFGQKLFFIDGNDCYLYNYSANTLDKIGSNNAYIPLVTISKSPAAGGTSYESLNLVQPGFYEQFIVTSADSTTKNFYLSFSDLDNTTVRAWILNSYGRWEEKYENTDFYVTRMEGLITFISAPGETPISGEDNVRILAYRTVDGYANRIKKCRFGTLFGVNGASDRLFLSGNPDYPNYDWYSEQYDPTYFPDTGYAALGVEISAIVGYSLVNNYLATHKDDKEPSQSVFIREGDLIKRSITTSVGTTVEISEPAFKLINTLQGASALTPFTFGYLQTEPLFLTKSGIFALTTQDITGDKYGQDRSFYLNGSLMEENNLDTAYSCVFDNMYYLAVNTKVYLLDALQATRTDRSDPYSTRQYVGFVWNNIPATIIYTDDDYLWFGTADGKICRFYKDVDALESYNDDGYPIDAWWETPDLDGKLFYKNKTFRYYAARLMSALATSVKMWAMKAGAWTLIKSDNQTGRYFDFENVNFEKFSFSTDQTEKVVHTKIKVKKVDKARFKLENDVLNEPFGLFNIALEYVENGNYKG